MEVTSAEHKLGNDSGDGFLSSETQPLQQQVWSSRELVFRHSAMMIYAYLSRPEWISLQQLNKRYYRVIIPYSMPKVVVLKTRLTPLPACKREEAHNFTFP